MELQYFKWKQLCLNCLASLLKGGHLELLTTRLKWNCNTWHERNSVWLVWPPCQKGVTWNDWLPDSNGTATLSRKATLSELFGLLVKRVHMDQTQMELQHFQEKQLCLNCVVSLSKRVNLELLTSKLKWKCNIFKERNYQNCFNSLSKGGPLGTTDCRIQMKLQHFQGKKLFQNCFNSLSKGGPLGTTDWRTRMELQHFQGKKH